MFPNGWRLSFLLPVPKKGNLQDPNNYRGIAINSCLSKVCLSVINTRVCVYMEENNLLDKAQHGFRKDFRTSDNLFILKTLVKKQKASNRKPFTRFVDFSKAFDCVWRHGLLQKLVKHGIDGKVYHMIANMYSEVTYTVKTQHGLSNYIHSNIGLKQGCVCSPTLFNIYVNDIQDYLKDQASMPPLLYDTPITHLLFADDLVLLSTSMTGLQHSINCLHQFCNDWRLQINTAKTKVLIFNCPPSVSSKYVFSFGTYNIELTESYIYLGISLHRSGSFNPAVTLLNNKAMRAWFKIKQSLCTSDETPTHILLHMFNSVSKQISLYGCEVWGADIVNVKSTNLFHNWGNASCNRTIIKVAKSILDQPKRCSNVGALVELGIQPISLDVYISVLKYHNRLSTQSCDKLVYKAFMEDKTISNCLISTLSKSVDHIYKCLDIRMHSNKLNLGHVTTCLKKRWWNVFVAESLPTNPITGKSNKLRLYGQTMTSPGAPVYLSSIKVRKYKRALTCMRLSNHPLLIEQGRYKNLDVADRLCPLCTDNIEDEAHV
jgi:hypothetical protein